MIGASQSFLFHITSHCRWKHNNRNFRIGAELLVKHAESPVVSPQHCQKNTNFRDEGSREHIIEVYQCSLTVTFFYTVERGHDKSLLRSNVSTFVTLQPVIALCRHADLIHSCPVMPVTKGTLAGWTTARCCKVVEVYRDTGDTVSTYVARAN